MIDHVDIPAKLIADLDGELVHQAALGVPGSIVVSIDVDGRGHIIAWEFGGKRRRTLPRGERQAE